MKYRIAVLSTASLLLMGVPAHAQFFDRLINPDVLVTMTHPPSLGIKVQRVAFAPVKGEAAEELVSACIADLSSGGQLEVLDRSNIEKVLREQQFGQSGMVDTATAVSLGKLLGSPVLLLVKVFRLQTKEVPLRRDSSYTDKNGYTHTSVTFISKTQADFSASIQAIDLATGKIYAEKRFASTPSLEKESTQGQPEYPTETEVRELAMNEAKGVLHKMLLSWMETRKLIFYDDKDYGMKDAYKQLELKDYHGALAKSLDSLEKAKADPKIKPKYLGRTNYNVGMCYFINGEYDAAIPFLKAARETDTKHTIFREGAEQCERAISLRDEMSKVDTRSAKFETPVPKQEALETQHPSLSDSKRGGSNGGNALSVEDRLKRLDDLKKKGLLTPQEYKKRKAEIVKDL